MNYSILLIINLIKIKNCPIIDISQNKDMTFGFLTKCRYFFPKFIIKNTLRLFAPSLYNIHMYILCCLFALKMRTNFD